MKYPPCNSGLVRGLLALAVSLAVITSSHAFVFASFGSPNGQNPAEPFQGDEGLLSAAAVLTEAGVRVEWISKFDADNLGFNVYRLMGRKRTRINREIIPGSVFVFGPNDPRTTPQNRSSAAHSYAWFDPAGTKDSVYYIESVSLDGASRLHGPVTSVPEGQAPATMRIPLVNELDAQTLEIASTDASDVTGSSQVGYPAGYPAGVLPQITASQIQDQWAIVAQPALKIAIKKDGWYRVTQPQMVAAGFNPSVDIRNLQLFVDSQELAISTSRSGGQFGATDYVEFFGRGIDVPSSDLRIYYLIAAGSPGKRVGGEIQVDSPPSPPAPSPTPLAMPRTPPKAPARSPVTDPVATPIWSTWIWRSLDVSPRYPTGLPAVAVPIPPSVRRGEVEPSTVMSNVITPANPAEPKASAAPYRVATPAESTSRVEPAAKPLGAVDVKIAGLAGAPGAPRAQFVSKKKTSRHNSRKQRNKNRLHQERAEPRREYSHAVSVAAVAPSNFAYTIERKDRTIYFSSLLNGDAENWFGQVVAGALGAQISQTLTVPNPDLSATGSATLEFALQGVANQAFSNHLVNVSFNGAPIASLNFGALDHPVVTVSIPISQLLSGANTLTFTKASTGESSIVDYARITYPHQFKADSGSLQFNLRGSQTRTVDGFSTPLVRLIDYTDPFAVSLTKPVSAPSALGFAITVPTSASRSKNQRSLYAVPQAQFDQPAALSLNQPSTLNLNSNAGDFLIISHKNLIPSFTANVSPINTSLVAQRQSQGLVPKIVDVEDIFDEFGYGLHGPQALKDFLLHASTNWATPPRYIIFAGDASIDPRNYTGLGNFDFVPTKLVDATYSESASDDWLADFDNNGVANIPVGRLPVRTAAEADLIVSKIVNYAPANVPQHALLVADDPGFFYDFEVGSDNVQALLPSPPSMAVQKSYRRLEIKVLTGTISTSSGSLTVTGSGTLFTTEMPVGKAITKVTGELLGTVASVSSATSLTLTANAASTHTGVYGKQDDPTATARIIAGLNEGRTIVNYSGHGTATSWTGAAIFTATHATALTNGNKLAFVVVMDCLNGYYNDPSLLSLSEAFMKAPNGGAVAVFASSGLTVTFGQREMELALYAQLYGGAPMALGDAIKISKTASSDIDVRRTWIYFGDPSLQIRP